jgi:hypothetical protein
MADRTGQQFGNYRLVTLLGQGGYAEIYLNELPFITLYSAPMIAMVRKGTHHYQISPFSGEINSWEWWCDNGKC